MMRWLALMLLCSCAGRDGAAAACFEPTITQGVYGSATYVSDVVKNGHQDHGVEPGHPILVSQDRIESVVASARTDGAGNYEVGLGVGAYLITDDRSVTAPLAFSIEAGSLVRVDVEDLFVTESWGFGAPCP